MKQISIQDLKSNLSAVVAEAESGNTIVITRHNQAVAKLIPAHSEKVFRGRDVGKGGSKLAFKRRTKIPYLATLLADRADR